MLKLLLVEDSESDQELIEYHIRKSGMKFDLTRVDSKADFQAAMDREKWDLLLTDFALPSFNAWDVLRIARTHDADIPVILVTGTKPERFGPDFMRKGAIDYLLKTNLTRLGSAIKGALARSRLARDLKESRLQVEELTDQVKSLQQEGPAGIAHEIHKNLEPKLDAFKVEVLSVLAEQMQTDANKPLHEGSSPGGSVAIGQILSPREFKVIKLMTGGKSLKEIAAELAVSPKTISTYRQRILLKLRLQSTAELMLYAAKHQIGDR